MKADNAIEVCNVTKNFKVYLDKGHTIKEKILFSKRRKYEERVVLNGISFEVKKGEAIGLIGQNGCGKSTTLKLLTRIMYPDSGSIQMAGRVSSLIELGAGFHPDMSGRQNIYTNASIFGLTRKEIEQRLNDIIAFSELEEFIDNPVRTYSSGMYMRLAFSVAINVDADILLIDEILAVGDANFQAKCFNKLRDIKAQGTTIVIVSHSMGQIEQICDRSIWIHDGQIRAEGKPRDIHPLYLDFMGGKRKERVLKEQKEAEERKIQKTEGENNEEKEQNKQEIEQIQPEILEEPKEDAEKKQQNPDRFGNKKAVITKIEIKDNDGEKRNIYELGEDINFEISYQTENEIEDGVFGIEFIRNDGVYIYGTNTLIDMNKSYPLKNQGMVILTMKNIQLLPGVYDVGPAINVEHDMEFPLDFWRKACQIEIYASKSEAGLVSLSHKWKI